MTSTERTKNNILVGKVEKDVAPLSLLGKELYDVM